MKIEKHVKDQMTPIERIQAIQDGQPYDRLLCVPFMGELKCKLIGISYHDFWHDKQKIIETEIAAFNRYGYDRIVIGPNTRGITECLGGEFVYPENGLPHMKEAYIKEYSVLSEMERVNVSTHSRITLFEEIGAALAEQAKGIVPIEMSVGGLLTIASNLRGVEILLRDLRRNPEEVHRFLAIVANAQKECIDIAAKYGLGIAMADPVANPALIGPRMYGEFVFPYTKELIDYAFEKTGYKVSLHMCGETYSIWKYLRQYQLNELSLDNLIDMNRAVEELGPYIPIAGNVDPVEIVMNGTREEIEEAVEKCAKIGCQAEHGYTLATGCDIPEITSPEQVDYFMDAARKIDNHLQI